MQEIQPAGLSQKTQQQKIIICGEELLKKIELQPKASIFSKDFWYGSVMDWSMKNEKFKTNMFRFVDVLPSLNSGEEVSSHLKEYFTEDGKTELPAIFNVGLGLGSLAPGLMAGAIKKNVTAMAKMFITGENPEEALTVLKKARKNNLTFTVDILGEATLSENEANEYQKRYLELIDWLSNDAKNWPDISLLDFDADGPIPKINVSVKMTALYSQINQLAWTETKDILKERLRPLFKRGIEKNVFINLDMENYGVKHLTLEVFKELMSEPELKNYKFFGCVIQAYLRDSLDDVRDLINFARTRGTPFTIRLVKGAYWDSETIEAKQKNWNIPVYLNKAESDSNFELCSHLLLENYSVIRLALASHNVRSLSSAIVKAEELKLPKNSFEIQMLYGMAEPIKKTFSELGYRVREYAPVGELIPGMAYLVRRLLENTSNESWLRGKFAEGKSTDLLLKDPSIGLRPTSSVPKTNPLLFKNEAYLDFAIKDVRQNTMASIQALNIKLPVKIRPILNGVEVTETTIFERSNPSQSNSTVAKIEMASIKTAETAMKNATTAHKKWKNTPAEKRALILERAANLMVAKRFELMAEQIIEVGKYWSEADADVCEAIDFLRYYARQMRELSLPSRAGHAPGEHSQYIYKSRGVCVVIAPWNFPLAILAGQVCAALVSGNTVVMKPAEQSTLVALGLYKILIEAGLPAETLQFLPGYGEIVGDYVVKYPTTATIAFTGSKTVGLLIQSNAAIVQPGQNHVKRCIIEMGGKNSIIVDNDADLDEAVDGVLYSAFGFSGQKCSACSKVIVLSSVYDRFVQRLVQAASSLEISSAMTSTGYFGPVVDEEAFKRLHSIIDTASKKYKVLFKGDTPSTGYYVPAVIFGEVKSMDDLSVNEFFGPILAVMKATTLSDAIELANQTEYALTGGLFSRSPGNIEKVKSELEVGNLYINRGITGAMVDRHPFGGFKMSGIGSKTGGPDYLRQFLEPIVVTENTMRRGFAPEVEGDT